MLGSARSGSFIFSTFDMTTPITFLKQTYDELKLVKWPTRNEIIRLTSVVIFISVAIGLYIGGIDYVLTQIMGALLK
jgi:preprotein translocase SecE subunit